MEEEIPDETAVDVVIVMDISNTMNATHEGLTVDAEGYKVEDSRLYDAKTAARNFVTQYYTAPNISSERRLGLVTFNSDANILIDLQQVNRTMPATIESIIAPAGDRRFTNIEGGLLLAQKMLANSTSPYKFIILITDGFPTTYTQTQGGRTMTGYDTYDSNGAVFKNRILNKNVMYGCDYSEEAAIRARNVAKTMKNSGIDIVSIGVDVGVQTIQGYLNIHDGKSFSTVDNKNNAANQSGQYEIGQASSSSNFKSWLGGTLTSNGLSNNGIGGGPHLSAGQTYYDGDSQTQLNAAFTNILSIVEQTASRAMGDSAVKDPMGANAEFLGFYNKSGAFQAGPLSGSHTLNAENTAAYSGSSSAGAIDWDLTKSGYTITTTMVDDVQVNRYTHTLKYRIRLENEAAGFDPAASHPANDGATLTYDDPSTPTDDSKKLIAPDPEVKGYLGSLSFTKTGETPEGSPAALEGASFVLSHSANCTVCGAAGHKVAIADRSAVSAHDGKVEITNIPSGHDYILKETSAPQNYIPVGDTNITVAYGETTGLPTGSTVSNARVPAVELSVTGTKVIENHDLAGYSFELKDVNRTVLATATSDTSGAFGFTLPKIHSAGTYFYEVTEVVPANASESNIIYDPAVYHISVVATIEDDHFVTSTTITNHTTNTPVASGSTSSTVGGMVFTNAVRPSASVLLEAEKTLTGRNMEAGEFSFELKGSDGKVLQTKPNDAYGKVVFDALKFDAIGTHTYTITERVGSLEHVVYDTEVCNVTVTVAPNENGDDYQATAVYTKGNASSNTFQNTYMASLVVVKAHADGTAMGGAEFQLIHKDGCCGASVETLTAVSRASDGYTLFSGIPSGHTYILRETAAPKGHVPAPDHLVVVKRGIASIYEMDSNSELAAPHIIVNYPEAKVLFSGQKSLFGRSWTDEDTFQIELLDSSLNVLKTTTAEKDTGAFSFALTYNGVSMHSRNTDDFVYYIRETAPDGDREGIVYDTTWYRITVQAGMDSEHQVSARIKSLEKGTMNGSSFTAESVSTQFATPNEAAGIRFVNTYGTEPVAVELGGTKALIPQGSATRTLKAGDFSFTISAVSWDETAQAFVKGITPTQVVSNDADGRFQFKSHTYTTPGSFYYIVEEVNAGMHGMTYDTAKYRVAIYVEDNGHGELVASKYVGTAFQYVDGEVVLVNAELQPNDILDADVAFTNTYSVEDTADLTLSGTKTLTGRNLNADEFLFLLYETDSTYAIAKDANPLDIAYNQAPGALPGTAAFSFHPIVFDQNDIGETHYYVVKESNDGLGGVSYDDSVYQVKATVLDNQDGTIALEKTVTLIKDGASSSASSLAFANSYTVEGSVDLTLSGTKTLTGRDLAEGEFRFALYETDGTYALAEDAEPIQLLSNGKPDEVTGVAAFSFLPISYSVANIGETHYYVVKELNDGLGGVEYDQTLYQVKAEIYDNGEGAVAMNKTITALLADGSSSAAEALAFANTYTVDGSVQLVLPGIKTLTGRDLGLGEFQFALYETDNTYAVAEDAVPLWNAANGTPDAVTGEAGFLFVINYDASHVGQTHYYVVKELDNGLGGIDHDETLYLVKAELTHDGEGTLVLNKTITALYEDETEASAETLAFHNSYRITEPYGELTISGTKLLSGRKLLDDEFAFALYEADSRFREGDQEETVRNKADGTFTFSPLRFDELGTYYYLVNELTGRKHNVTYDDTVYYVTVQVTDDLKGGFAIDYSVAYADGSDAGQLLFDNHYDSSEDPTPTPTPGTPGTPGGAPQTGDNSQLGLWLGLLAAGAGGIIALVVLRRKRDEE